jgi:hypothetical protein
MNATLFGWKALVVGALMALGQSVQAADLNRYQPVSHTVNTVATQSAAAPVYGPAPLAPAAAKTAATGEQKTAFWGCWDPCYTRPVCRTICQPSYGYGYGTPGCGVPGYGVPGYGVPGYGAPGYGVPGYGVGYGAGYGVPGYGAPGYGVPGYGVPGYGVPAYGAPYGAYGVSNSVPAITAPVGIPAYGTPGFGAPSVVPAVAPYGASYGAPYVAPAVNPGFPGAAPGAPYSPYGPFFGSKDATKVNAKAPVDVGRNSNPNSPYFK